MLRLTLAAAATLPLLFPVQLADVTPAELEQFQFRLWTIFEEQTADPQQCEQVERYKWRDARPGCYLREVTAL